RFPVEARDARRSHPGGGAVRERGGAPRAAARRGGAASLGAAAARVRAAAGGTLTPSDAGDRRAGDLAAGGSRGAVGRGEGPYFLTVVSPDVRGFAIVCVVVVGSTAGASTESTRTRMAVMLSNPPCRLASAISVSTSSWGIRSGDSISDSW